MRVEELTHLHWDPFSMSQKETKSACAALLKPNIRFTQELLRWDEHNKPAVLKVNVNDAQNNSHKS